MKYLIERLTFAALGTFFGALVGVLLWFLYDYGASLRLWPPEIHLGLRVWCMGFAGVFALVGLVLGAETGTVIGSILSVIFRFESYEDMQEHSGRLRYFLLALILICAVWFFMHSSR